MEAEMKPLAFVAASSLLLGTAAAASPAHHRIHHYGAYGAYGSFYGRYGAYSSFYDPYGAYGSFASTNRYRVYGPSGAYGDGCHLRFNQRPEELAQDRYYQETLGEPC
jgi:hypothetical protein